MSKPQRACDQLYSSSPPKPAGPAFGSREYVQAMVREFVEHHGVARIGGSVLLVRSGQKSGDRLADRFYCTKARPVTEDEHGR